MKTVAPWREQTHPISHRFRVRPRPQVLVSILLLAAAFPVRFSVGGGRTASLFDAAARRCYLRSSRSDPEMVVTQGLRSIQLVSAGYWNWLRSAVRIVLGRVEL